MVRNISHEIIDHVYGVCVMDAVAAVTVGDSGDMRERGQRQKWREGRDREIEMEKGEGRDWKVRETIGNSGLLCQNALP